MTVWVEADLCNGCKRCLRGCPYGALEFSGEKASVLDRCTSCGACIELCRQGALKSDILPRTVPDFSDWKGIWVFAERRDGQLSHGTLELLGKARQLAEVLDQEVCALLVGHGVSHLAQTLIRYGARTVYLAEHEELAHYRTLPYTDVLEGMIEKYRPGVFLMSASHLGRDLAPRVSRRVGAGLTADCTELEVDPDEKILLQTRPAFGGNVMATIVSRYSRPQMATVRPGVMEAVERPENAGRVVTVPVWVSERSCAAKLLETVREKKDAVKLCEAKVIVAGGRGLGDAGGFRLLEELAEIVDGAVAGTRVAVEEGWIPADRQVGQTGQSVRPELYIACGISGAIQHRAGMLNSRYVLAINKDPRAPIFQVADWGIRGDLREVIPELVRQLKRGL
ncbi:MAG: electron transfer flavoprotein subunit alpha [Syntrophobacteraceae bacterium]|nr:electron transfer flavoprotein subunit alpha [Syntrophobacteraceae bacterium]